MSQNTRFLCYYFGLKYSSVLFFTIIPSLLRLNPNLIWLLSPKVLSGICHHCALCLNPNLSCHMCLKTLSQIGNSATTVPLIWLLCHHCVSTPICQSAPFTPQCTPRCTETISSPVPGKHKHKENTKTSTETNTNTKTKTKTMTKTKSSNRCSLSPSRQVHRDYNIVEKCTGRFYIVGSERFQQMQYHPCCQWIPRNTSPQGGEYWQ